MKDLLKRIGPTGATVLVTGLTLVASHLIAWPAMLITGARNYLAGALITTLCPIVICSPPYYLMFRVLAKLDAREQDLQSANRKLRRALDQVQELSGLLPICSYCKKIRDDTGYWSSLEGYLDQHSKAQLTHSVCPECAQKVTAQLRRESGTGRDRNQG